MAARNIPYPPSPSWIPADLMDVGDDTRRDTRSLMTTLVLFIARYLSLVLACLRVVALGLFLSVRHFMAYVGVPMALVAGCFAFLLIRVLFYRPGAEKGLEVEVTEDEQPVLFAFLRRLTREIGAPEPDRVFVTHDINAAVVSNLSLAYLVIPPRRDLHIRLGLVNVLTLGEFKAVMGHEFGHFAQSTGRKNAYIEVALRVLGRVMDGGRCVSRAKSNFKSLRNIAPD